MAQRLARRRKFCTKLSTHRPRQLYPAQGEKELIRARLNIDLQSAQFPERLTLPDPLPQEITFWKSTQKPTSTLEELALVKGFHYLLLIPLVRQNEQLGALTAAGFCSQPDEDSLRKLKLIASSAAGILHHLTRVENAQRNVQRTRQIAAGALPQRQHRRRLIISPPTSAWRR